MIRLDITKALVSAGEVAAMENKVAAAQQALENGTCAGNDFLGWLHLPSSITAEFLTSIQECAQTLRENCDTVVVAGIGGSYLGARAIIEALGKEFIEGLSVLGGEPFEEENQAVLAPFLTRVRKTYPEKNIWCFTGYLYEKDLKAPDGRKHTEYTDAMLSCIDVLVDGPFIEDLKDISLRFRGSRNQRILHLKDGLLVP